MVLTHAPVQSGDFPESIPSEADARLGVDRTARERSRVHRLGRQSARYAAALLWVACDALPRYKTQVCMIVVCNVLGLAATAGAVGGVMSCARAAEHDRPVRILSYHWHLGSSVKSLLIFGAAIAALGLISAACTYVVDRMILTLARRYHIACADRAIAIAADPLCRGWQAMLDDPPRLILSRMAGGASRVMGLVLRDLLRVILPLLTVIAVVAFLFYIDATLTLVLLPATALYMIPLYVINRRVTRMQREYRALTPQARSDVGRRLREMLHTGQLEQGVESVRRDALQAPAYQGALASFYNRLLADRRVHLLNTAFFILCLVALLIFFGIQARDHARPWSDLIFYLLALRYAMTSLKQTTALGAKFSRFFPEYHLYADFITQSRRTRERRAAERDQPHALPESLTLRLGRAGRWDSPRLLRIDRSGTVMILTYAAPGHADLEAMVVRLERRVEEDVDLATRAVFAAQAEGLEQKHFADAPVIVLGGLVAGRDRTAAMLESRSIRTPRLTVIVQDDLSTLNDWPAWQTAPDVVVLVSDGVRFVAGGDMNWLRGHVEAIAAFLREAAEAAKRRGAGDDGEDDEEDEDSE